MEIVIKAIVKGFIRIFFCNVFYRVKYIGKENIEKMDKCLICPNHSNTLEPTWIYAITKNISIMAKAELFENKFLAKLYRYFNVFPIHRGEHDIRSLIHAINLFKNTDNMKLLVFPEGERLKKEVDRIKPKVGPAYIASKAKVPMIPVYITKNAKMFSKVYIVFGEPMYPPNNKERLQEFSNHFMDVAYGLKSKIPNKVSKRRN